MCVCVIPENNNSYSRGINERSNDSNEFNSTHSSNSLVCVLLILLITMYSKSPLSAITHYVHNYIYTCGWVGYRACIVCS